MRRQLPAQTKTILALSLLLSATALTAARVTAADRVRPQHDGLPTAATCAELGFPQQRADEDGATGKIQGLFQKRVRSSVAPLAPSPAPTMEMEAMAPVGGAVATADAIGGELPYDTEKYPDATANPIKQVDAEPVSTFSIDVDTASYANVRRFLNDGTLPPRDAVRVEEMVNYFDYGYAPPTDPAVPFAIHTSVVPSPWAAGKEIVHIGLQGYDLAEDNRPPLNLVFLMDVSGSMNDPTKLPLVQKALNLLIDELRPEDHVSIAVYAGAAGAVLQPTPGDQKLKIRCAVDAMRAGGSTAGGEGLALAYQMAEQSHQKDSVTRVILMTDGDFNVGIADPEKLEDFVAEKRDTGVYLSVYGFGRGNYNDVMMQTLSQTGNGTAAYIDTLQEARKLFRDDFSGSLFPIADDVKIQVEFNPDRVAEYRLIGYETRLLNREDFNNDQVDAGEVGAGASVTALYEITPAGGKLSVDPLRYEDAPKKVSYEPDAELAYVKVRYKLPGADTSELIEEPIGDADRPAALAEAPEATRWALAVAAYGQRLRGDPWMDRSFDWTAIGDLAQGARGQDPFGIRAEFVQLVRAADRAKSVNE
ncbi:vWA domain-containing protein [Bauldia litoralis]|uniref:vWA domain-containing protein n=1 Tax=Bauldia litoralis TaxID=665467 RepID=UPI003265A45C